MVTNDWKNSFLLMQLINVWLHVSVHINILMFVISILILDGIYRGFGFPLAKCLNHVSQVLIQVSLLCQCDSSSIVQNLEQINLVKTLISIYVSSTQSDHCLNVYNEGCDEA